MSVTDTLSQINQPYKIESTLTILNLDKEVVKRCFGRSLSNLVNNNYNGKEQKNSKQRVLNNGKRTRTQETEMNSDSEDQWINLTMQQYKYRKTVILNLNLSQEQVVTYKKQNITERNTILNWIALIYTLHAAAHYINRYLTIKSLDIDEYQKLAITCLWMAAKMEERKIKQLRAWLQFGKGFEWFDIVEMEGEILQTLGFNLTIPNAYHYFKIFCSFYTLDQRVYFLCNYILQLTLIDCSYTDYQPSHLALSSLYLAFKISNLDIWREKFERLCNRNADQIRQCSKQLCKTIQTAHCSQLSSIYRKYSSSKYRRVALIKFGKRSSQIIQLQKPHYDCV